MWNLKGIKDNIAFEQASMDIEYLKALLQHILYNDGAGFIYRESKNERI